MRAFAICTLLVASALPSMASAQDVPADRSQRFADPTGGAYTSPSPLFTPAAALPSLMPRLTVGADIQSAGTLDALRPFINAELGLPAGFTVAAGTQWFGGDQPVGANSLTPFAQVRYQIFGRADGMGLLGGASLTYKRVGYHGGENELEASFSMQYRAQRFEVGAQGTFGQSLEEGEEHDIEARIYAAYRVIPSLALGVTGQVRGDIGEESAEIEAERARLGRSEFDFIGGATASYTFSRWQIGTLLGASTLGLYEQVAFLGQVQGQVRF